MNEKIELNQELLSMLEYYRKRGMSDEQIELLCICVVILYDFCFVELLYFILVGSLKKFKLR
ncbi:MAG: hypothetical protein K2I03_12345 [Lachnospiraceae bacterium]|nr:hypothetical protein [Lachnospiraceae bacterium]